MKKLLASALLSLSITLPAQAAWTLAEPDSVLLVAIGLAGLAAILHHRNRK